MQTRGVWLATEGLFELKGIQRKIVGIWNEGKESNSGRPRWLLARSVAHMSTPPRPLELANSHTPPHTLSSPLHIYTFSAN